MISVDDALEAIVDATPMLPDERLAVSSALYRVAAGSVESSIDLPPFAQSAMDGYAIRAADTREAREDAPVELKVVGDIAAGGGTSEAAVGAGEAVRIATGGAVPDGADAIVRQERVRREGRRIVIESPVPDGADLRPVGEELERGAPIVDPGTRLDERHLSALSMTGTAEVAVRRQPRIALLVSGDEVVAPEEERRPGEIYDANTPFLEGLLRRLGYEALEVQHLADDGRDVEEAVEAVLDACDLVLSTGGVSVGEYDYFGDAASAAGVEEVFWGVDQKPGRPVYFGVRGHTPFLGLPGNPGAVYVDAHLYLTRLLDTLEGCEPRRPRFRRGRLAGPIDRSSRRTRWSPCRTTSGPEGSVELEPIERGRAHRMGQLFRADALVRVDPGGEVIEPGAEVTWIRTV